MEGGKLISLKFNKPKKEPRRFLQDSKFRDESTRDEEEERDYVTSVDRTQIHGTKKKEVKKELVIPLIKRNEWRVRPDDDEEEEGQQQQSLPEPPKAILSLEQRAIQELLLGGGEKKDVPILLQNQVPAGYEQDEGALDVSVRPNESNLVDYERVPIEEFGMAMLRGMGWTKKDGIGLTNKQHIEMIEPKLRPKGLGLGASISTQAKKDVSNSTGRKEEEVELCFKIGAGAVILRGSDKGMYGKIEAFDEDNNRIVLKLAISGKMATVSKFHINLVSESDYKTKSKVLNYDLYSEYKEKQDKKEEDRRRDKEKERREKDREDDAKSKTRDKDSSRSKKSSKRDDDYYNDYKSSTKNNKSHSSNGTERSWVRPHLKVRFIDEKYHRGKYYEKKFIVEDVLAYDRFILKSEPGGTILEDIKASQVETVIPKESGSAVYILHGRFKGRVGTVEEKNRKEQTCIIRIPDGGVCELEYDDLCEFVGDPEDFY